MNFIDYVTLMLTNMTAALVVLAAFLWKGMNEENPKHWAPAFAVPGLVAVIAGFTMTFTWPLPDPFNIPYGELSVLLGMLLLGAAWALARGWSLLPLGNYAFFAGAAAILLGIRIIDLSLTNSPLLSGIGFILTGSGGIFAGFTLRHAKSIAIRFVGSLTMLAAAAIWALTASMAYWYHMIPPE